MWLVQVLSELNFFLHARQSYTYDVGFNDGAEGRTVVAHFEGVIGGV